MLTVLRLEVEALPVLSVSSAASDSRDDGTATGSEHLVYLVTNGWLKNAENSILSLAFLLRSLQ